MLKCRKSTAAALVLHFVHDEDGATAIEYAMIASGIAVAIAATIMNLGTAVNGLYSNVLTAMK